MILYIVSKNCLKLWKTLRTMPRITLIPFAILQWLDLCKIWAHKVQWVITKLLVSTQRLILSIIMWSLLPPSSYIKVKNLIVVLFYLMTSKRRLEIEAKLVINFWSTNLQIEWTMLLILSIQIKMSSHGKLIIACFLRIIQTTIKMSARTLRKSRIFV